MVGRGSRPGYHVAPEVGWINDPNGPIEWDGRFHLFFQRNPLAAAWAPRVHWGHAVSDDLCAWSVWPDALEPSKEGPDAGGCWSGCVVDDAGTPTAVYSGLASGATAPMTVCLARGDATLGTWRKDSRNPVIAGPPAGAALTAFRDPFVWREDGRWRMVIGAGMPDGGGAVLAYSSPGLLRWEPEGVLCRAAEAGIATGPIWECPQYFRLGGRRVLLISVWDGEPSHAVALVGSEAGGRFTVGRAVRFDHGADCYSPATMLDSSGRRLAWAWAWEAHGREAGRAGESAGALTLPRVLTLAWHARRAGRDSRHHRSGICGIDRPPGSPVTRRRGAGGDRPAPRRPGAGARSLAREPRSGGARRRARRPSAAGAGRAAAAARLRRPQPRRGLRQRAPHAHRAGLPDTRGQHRHHDRRHRRRCAAPGAADLDGGRSPGGRRAPSDNRLVRLVCAWSWIGSLPS